MTIRSDTQIHIAGAAALVTCCAAVYLLGVAPAMKAIGQLHVISVENEQLQSQLPTMQTQIVDLREQVTAKSKQLASRYTVNMASNQPLIGAVSQLLSYRNIELLNLREEASTTQDGTTIVMQINGKYDHLARFLYDLRWLERPARINTLNMTPLDARDARCSLRLSVTFFPPLPPIEMPLADSAQSSAPHSET